MKIGIVGLGCIGSANQKGFYHLGHEVFGHDIKLDTSIEDVLNTDITFICVPTPANEDGRCDTSIVASVIADLHKHNYRSIIAIRSTVSPGFTQEMQHQFPNMKICFSPEFLRERMAVEDFIENHQLLVAGTDNADIAALIQKAHGNLPVNFIQMAPQEAELLKYFNNVYAALRITFANVFYEICDIFDADYKKIKDAYVKTGKAIDLYFNVNEDLRGFAGMCLPKDTKAISKIISDNQLKFKLIDAILKDNDSFKKTIIGDMRM